MDFSLVMAAIAQAVADAEIDGVGERAFGWPVAECPVPCFVVGYPEGDMNLNLAYGSPDARPLVRGTYQAWWITGAAVARTTPAQLGAVIAEIKAAIDGDLGGVVDSALVLTASIAPVVVGAQELLSVRLVIDVVS